MRLFVVVVVGDADAKPSATEHNKRETKRDEITIVMSSGQSETVVVVVGEWFVRFES